MKDEFTGKEEETIESLQQIKDVPERPQAQIERGKAAFLAEAAKISGEIADQSSTQPVSIPLFRRLINSFTQPKPQLRLSTLTISIILVSVLFVTFSGSVFAARNALPDQLLYPYKLWLEDTRMAVTRQTDSQIDLHLTFADERLREYQALGLAPEDPLYSQVFENYSYHLESASQLLAGDGGQSGQHSRLEDLQDRYQQLVPMEDSDDEKDLQTPEDELEDDSLNEDRLEDAASEEVSEPEETEDADHEAEKTKEQEDSSNSDDESDDDTGDESDDDSTDEEPDSGDDESAGEDNEAEDSSDTDGSDDDTSDESDDDSTDEEPDSEEDDETDGSTDEDLDGEDDEFVS